MARQKTPWLPLPTASKAVAPTNLSTNPKDLEIPPLVGTLSLAGVAQHQGIVTGLGRSQIQHVKRSSPGVIEIFPVIRMVVAKSEANAVGVAIEVPGAAIATVPPTRPTMHTLPRYHRMALSHLDRTRIPKVGQDRHHNHFHQLSPHPAIEATRGPNRFPCR